MATVGNAVPVKKAVAEAVLQLVCETAKAVQKPEPLHMSWDVWQNSTPRKGIRTARIRFWVNATLPENITPKYPENGWYEAQYAFIESTKPARFAVLKALRQEITALVATKLAPANYRIIFYKETTNQEKYVSVIVYYISHS